MSGATLSSEAGSWSDVLLTCRRRRLERYDLRRFWRGESFLHAAPAAEVLVRAHACSTVLEQIPLQILLPFYRADQASGCFGRTEALDLLCHLWATIEELGDVTNITIGGMAPTGMQAVNELSYLCLEATQLVQSPRANLSSLAMKSATRPAHITRLLLVDDNSDNNQSVRYHTTRRSFPT